MLGQDFVHDGCTILTHGFSRVVLALLKLATANGKHFSVICTGINGPTCQCCPCMITLVY
jgi:translation initiation factor 2B subunit (eIF-2B alpha/beta/delta family)